MSLRSIRFVVALLLSILLARHAPAAADDATAGAKVGTLTVVVTGLKDDEGKLLVQLANSRVAYDKDQNPFRFVAVGVTNKRGSAVFEELPYGEYAIKVFHDANENGKLDFGLMGPKESYGFSNNARGMLGPADYDDAKFTFNSEALAIEIEAK